MSPRPFYDLPVYRLPRDAYYEAREKYIDHMLFPPDDPLTAELRARDNADPKSNAVLRHHLQRSYGGCWEFNEAIGYIRLHFLGTQVRGEYFAVSRKKIVRTRTKTFEYQTWKLAPEIEVSPPYGQADILAAVRTYIDSCRRQVPKRFIDTSVFEVVAPNIDWVAMFR